MLYRFPDIFIWLNTHQPAPFCAVVSTMVAKVWCEIFGDPSSISTAVVSLRHHDTFRWRCGEMRIGGHYWNFHIGRFPISILFRTPMTFLFGRVCSGNASQVAATLLFSVSLLRL
ncbi:hypothetical protein, unlikely [Trypanosoma brucei gambiense DAL972]|uniref:Uncharacterized protein n=1 Tax=Trypanosoma brucei gambiense (strain MHOM/CI/86/DAL972) TaxID=679716 RepID=D0AAI5_TRYB9|nr:hypothetical protein, unlikely [Trypanosoma brucei gambiense DAL972]CBH18686.1 hypothetical protein, unlikely [Trypanosoma brucei gambiense DAL972]|eukprot:XP_011780950.1 hypothetical protein, unlikely [Trypanosoma brucei gambiense DAL972]